MTDPTPEAPPFSAPALFAFLAVAIVVATAFAWHEMGRSHAAPAPTVRTAAPAVEELVATALREGVIVRMEPAASRVQLEPAAWASLNVDQKRGLASACAAWLQARGGDGWAHLYDYQSGRKLATWGMGHLAVK